MDYLVYAYLQSGRDREAARILEQLRKMSKSDSGDFKVAYAATAMPVRFAVERNRWTDAANIIPPRKAPPQVAAISVWARGLGCARTRDFEEARTEAETLRSLEEQLRMAGNQYWATQVKILMQEVNAWTAQASDKRDAALTLMRQAADEEDAVEKLPVTPGPIVPAREQLGYLLLEQHQPCLAAKEFRVALALAPGRRGALQGVSRATERCH
jgi:hypothetical protein